MVPEGTLLFHVSQDRWCYTPRESPSLVGRGSVFHVQREDVLFGETAISSQVRSMRGHLQERRVLPITNPTGYAIGTISVWISTGGSLVVKTPNTTVEGGIATTVQVTESRITRSSCRNMNRNRLLSHGLSISTSSPCRSARAPRRRRTS